MAVRRTILDGTLESRSPGFVDKTSTYRLSRFQVISPFGGQLQMVLNGQNQIVRNLGGDKNVGCGNVAAEMNTRLLNQARESDDDM